MLNIQFFTIGSEIAFSSAALVHKKVQMLKINRAANGVVVFMVSGQMDANNVTELRALFASEQKGRRIVLDLKDLTLVDQDAVRFLESCETDSITLQNCPAYIREWITRDREERTKENESPNSN